MIRPVHNAYLIMLRRSIGILTLLGSLTMGHVAAQERYWCGDAKPLPVEYPRSAPFKLDNLLFSSADELSYGQVELSAAPIEDFIFIVELLDATGRHVLSVAIDSKKPKDSSEFDSAVPKWYPAWGLRAWHWDRTLRPLNGSEAVQFWSPFVPSTCPISARLVGAQVRYRDGKRFEYKESELTLDPTLSRNPITNSQKWFDLMSLEFTGLVHIDASGHPAVTEVKSAAEKESQWLKDEISSWMFF